MGAVLVSHPHAGVVANATAAMLHSNGCLAAYFTGVAASEKTVKGRVLSLASRARPALRNRLVRGVTGSQLHSLFWAEGLARAGSTAVNALGMGRPSGYDMLFVLHDRVVAALRWPPEVDAVYAYEDGALRTFQRAARLGMRRVWDLPSPHYEAVERMWLEEFRRWPEAVGREPPVEPGWKKKRKDAELALATTVVVASSFARSSIHPVGVETPVVVTPYGFPIQDFPVKEKPPEGPFTVLAVGTQNVRKGTHYLLEAWRVAGLKDARLRIVGNFRIGRTFLSRYAGMFEHIRHVPRTDLVAEYQGADMVVFPTLCDGFGLVIQEAMCCGTPVVTTRCGGGPECIEDGVSGRIIAERSVDALVETLRWAIANRDRVNAMGRAARQRAEKWTWDTAVRAAMAAVRAT